MNKAKWLGLAAAILCPLNDASAQATAAPVAAEAAPAVPANLAPGAGEVVRLAEAGTSEDILLAYVNKATTPFRLSAEQILYLRDIGVSAPVITAMLNRDAALPAQAQTYNYNQTLYPPTAPPVAPAPAPVLQPAPEQVAPAPVSAPAPVLVSSPPPDVGYFYDSLSPYGAWVQLDGFGWCWQPRVVTLNHAWQPYCDSGHWVYTDAGWYWQSDYSWGWAPFHYGRWHLHDRCGWVWLPDRVWGPAWVTWRTAGDRCGWAPLPPHADFDVRLGWRFNGVSVAVNFDFGLRPSTFTFIALKDFHAHDLAHRRIAPAEVTRIYKQTTVINNYVVRNKTFVNEGIKAERVAEATHTQIQKVAIRDTAPPASGRVARTQGTEHGTQVIYRPQLKAPAPAAPARMVAQKVDDRHPVIQHAPVATAQRQPSALAPRPGTEKVYQPGYQAPRPTQPSPGRPPAESSQPPRVSTPSKPVPSEKSVPTAHPAAQMESSAHETTAPGQVSHVYYPKSYRQAAETHALPPLNPHSSAPAGNNSSGGSSKKHDQ